MIHPITMHEWERFCDCLQIHSFYLSVHYGKKIKIKNTFPTKLTRSSLSMFMTKPIICSKPKTVTFWYNFLKVWKIWNSTILSISITSPRQFARSIFLTLYPLQAAELFNNFCLGANFLTFKKKYFGTFRHKISEQILCVYPHIFGIISSFLVFKKVLNEYEFIC